MQFKVTEDVEEFSRKSTPILAEQEDLYSLFMGVLDGIKVGRYANPFMAWIEEEGEILALIQMTPPHPINLIFVIEGKVDECMDLLLKELMGLSVKINSVVTLKPWANQFADGWSNAKGYSYELTMDQGLYRLDQVNETLESSPGNWRLAEHADCQLIEKWFALFEEDAGIGQTDIVEVEKKVAAFVKGREVFLWEDAGRIVSMMKKSRPTAKGVTVSLVFTPREERKKGYARTLVAAISEELLKDFEFCVLYTDMMNPTSNKIYQEIGYKKIADSVMFSFLTK